MKEIMLYSGIINVLCFFMHEFDAFHRGEWKMFKPLRALSEKNQYTLFLYVHIPFCLFFFYYLWTVWNFSNLCLWIAVNGFGVLHLVIHLLARKWESNVFSSFHSFLFISGAALTGLINLLLVGYYR